MHLLIADDNATNLKLLSALMEAEGYRVSHAANGIEALEILKREKPDAIISDILMPEMDGYRLCFEVRQSEKLREIPFIIYTATYTSPSDEQLSLDLGADKYLRKPASPEQLRVALREAMASKPRRPSMAVDNEDVLREYSERLVAKLEEKNIELQQRTEELDSAHAQLRHLLAHSPAVIYTLKVEGEKLIPAIVSDNIERLLGFSVSEASSYDWWLQSLYPEDRDRVLDIVAKGVADGGYSMEYRIRHKDGSYRWVEDNNRVIFDESGKPIKMVGVWTDVTRRKQADEALTRAHDELEKRVEDRTAALALANEELHSAKKNADSANRAKSEFLSRMSHEFRTPMNAILGFGQLLEITGLKEQQQQNVVQILRAGKHLLGLINDILEISRIEAGSLSISLESVDVCELVSESVSLMQPTANERNVELNFDSKGPLHVKADRQKLRQVVLNLLSNAIKYNIVKGSVSVRLTSKNRSVSIEVTDTGIGISPAMLSKLFTPFERLGADGRGIEGTGLGLVLSRSLVEAMGGQMSVESKEGKGSVFRVQVPVAEAPAAPSTYLEAYVPDVKGVSAVRKVLLIEDNATNAKLLEQVFEMRPDLQLVVAMQGRLGLELAEELAPACVLLDLHLPDLAGDEVLKRMRAIPKLRNVPIIIVTADAFSAQSKKLIDAGAFAYIKKPFNLRELMSTVDAALGSASRAA